MLLVGGEFYWDFLSSLGIKIVLKNYKLRMIEKMNNVVGIIYLRVVDKNSWFNRRLIKYLFENLFYK